jgi:hypothetical protein
MKAMYVHHHQKKESIVVVTVEDKQRKYTPRQIANADKARALYRMLGRPSEYVFKHMISNGLIKNTDIITANITHVTDIYGPDVGSLKGKTVRDTPSPV